MPVNVQSDSVPPFSVLPFSIHSQVFLIPPDCTLQVCEVSSYLFQALATPPAHPPTVALAPVFDGSLIMAATRSAQVAINTTCPHSALLLLISGILRLERCSALLCCTPRAAGLVKQCLM